MLVLLGYLLARFGRWPESVGTALARFGYEIAIPALLFRMMSDFTRLPPVDARLLLAFFGGCLIVFVISRAVAARLFRLDGVAQSVFALGGVFSNNVMLGIGIAKTALGESALPAVSLVIVFNALILWTLVTVSVEWARHGEFSVHGLYMMALQFDRLRGPIAAGLVLSTFLSALTTPLVLTLTAPA